MSCTEVRAHAVFVRRDGVASSSLRSSLGLTFAQTLVLGFRLNPFELLAHCFVSPGSLLSHDMLGLVEVVKVHSSVCKEERRGRGAKRQARALRAKREARSKERGARSEATSGKYVRYRSSCRFAPARLTCHHFPKGLFVETLVQEFLHVLASRHLGLHPLDVIELKHGLIGLPVSLGEGNQGHKGLGKGCLDHGCRDFLVFGLGVLEGGVKADGGGGLAFFQGTARVQLEKTNQETHL